MPLGTDLRAALPAPSWSCVTNNLRRGDPSESQPQESRRSSLESLTKCQRQEHGPKVTRLGSPPKGLATTQGATSTEGAEPTDLSTHPLGH